MSEEEKIFAGKLFDARCGELRDLKHKAHGLCMKFNAMDEYDPERLPLVREFIGRIGEHYYFQGPIQFNYGCHTFIGEHVMCGPNVSLMATTHPLLPLERTAMRYPDGHVSMSEYAPAIHIGSYVWLACNVVVCAGVTIGEGSVIGAGSVVTRDIPAHTLAAGVPCRPIRPITEADSRLDLL